jgi:tetraacyldisaccharide 4'-kinase
MRLALERLEQFAVDVILEKRFGKRAFLLRVFLLWLSWIYGGVMRLRLHLFREHLVDSHPVGCLVISIGNLTVGGTGKTPVVEKFARALLARGRRVVVLSRGYKSKSRPLLERWKDRFAAQSERPPPRVASDGSRVLLDSGSAGDEPFMLASNLPGVPVLVDRDRVKSALYAIRRWGADTILLDDGLQYLRLQPQRVDVVLVDRQAPFGNEFILPRGTLREPHDHLSRADVILITKCEQPDQSELIERIRTFNRHAPIIECRHRPVHLKNLDTGELLPLDYLKELRIAAVSGIARPDSFEGFLHKLGAEICVSRQFADHHRFSESEIVGIQKRARHLRAKAIVTTEKDAVRFPHLPDEDRLVPVLFLRVEIDFVEGPEAFARCLDQILAHTHEKENLPRRR